MKCFAGNTFDMCTEGIETFVDLLIATVNLVDVSDGAGAIGTHGGNK